MAADDGVSGAGRAPDFVQSLERGLAVIRAFDSQNPVLTLSDVARRAGLTRAAARRYLFTLVELGYMRNEGAQFALTARVLSLGYAYLSGLSLPEVALPHMRDLASHSQESSSLAVLDDDEIVYIAQVPAERLLAVKIDVGTRFPAYATALGRILLAFAPRNWLDDYLNRVELVPATPFTVTSRRGLEDALDFVRVNGYSLVDQELDLGLRSLAVPLRDSSGKVIAAMNMSAHTHRFSDDGPATHLLPQLRAAAAAVESDLALPSRRPHAPARY